MEKVMVIDDDQSIVELLEAMLSLEGYLAVHTSDSTNAVNRVREESPSLILLDLMMPNVDGWQLLSALRKDRELQDIPVVMVTARADIRKMIADPARLGLAGFITKPFDYECLAKTVRQGLSIPQDSAASSNPIIVRALYTANA